ncbi:hypothetical protein D021_2311B, partial [Vibrio parahaemolyticus 10296]
LQSHETE